MQVHECNDASMPQVCNYASVKYTNMQKIQVCDWKYTSLKVCNRVIMQLFEYVTISIYNYASIEVFMCSIMKVIFGYIQLSGATSGYLGLFEAITNNLCLSWIF